MALPFVDDIDKRNKLIVLLIGAVHTTVDGDEPDVILGECDLSVHPHFQIITTDTFESMALVKKSGFAADFWDDESRKNAILGNSKHSKCSYTFEKRRGLTGISLQRSKQIR